MYRNFTMRLLPAFGALVALGVAAAAAAETQCRAESSTAQKVLVELYTSDGCSSCPPANQWLSAVLANRHSAIIPVSLHVTYWNQLGWRDAYSDPFFDQRQAWYASRADNPFSYTPEMIRNGREWHGWRGQSSDREREGPPAQVGLALELIQGTPGTLKARVLIEEAQSGTLPRHTDYQLVAFLYEDGLSEHPDAGELRGVLLRHDHVVRAWKTIDRPQFGQVQDVHFIVPPQMNIAKGGLIAFLQDRTSGAVLQAIDLPICR